MFFVVLFFGGDLSKEIPTVGSCFVGFPSVLSMGSSMTFYGFSL